MEKKRLNLIKIMMTIFSVSVLLTACGKNSNSFVDTTDLQQYKTEYVGDAPKVVNIISHQDYPKGYTYDYIEIQSETEPYGLKVYLNAQPSAAKIKDELQINANTTFDLIGNLGTLDYINSDSEECIASYERSED